jgi:hypothetical protein
LPLPARINTTKITTPQLFASAAAPNGSCTGAPIIGIRAARVNGIEQTTKELMHIFLFTAAIRKHKSRDVVNERMIGGHEPLSKMA